MKQIIRELKRHAASEKLEPGQLKGLIRAGYVYRNGDEHRLTDTGRHALAEPAVYTGEQPPGPVAERPSKKSIEGHPSVCGRPAAFRQAAERCARHHLRCWRGVSAAYPRRC